MVTNLGLFEVTPDGFLIKEIAPRHSAEEVQAVTEATLIVPERLNEFQVL